MSGELDGIDIFCDNCGKSVKYSVTDKGIAIELCQPCLERAESDAAENAEIPDGYGYCNDCDQWSDGKDEGRSEARDELFDSIQKINWAEVIVDVLNEQ